ncbi:MAG: DUF4956 domain-containing protein [Acidimicrobiales bacterium]
MGLGLFGVLSIIRLRSTELDHQATGYCFASLALGFLGGVQLSPALAVAGAERPGAAGHVRLRPPRALAGGTATR